MSRSTSAAPPGVASPDMRSSPASSDRSIEGLPISGLADGPLPGPQGFAHLSKHSLAGRSNHLSAERLAIRGAYQRGHLQQPHRGMGAQHVDNLAVLST